MRALVVGMSLALAGCTLWAGSVSPAQAVLRDLRAKGASDSFYFAWTHVWMSPWSSVGDRRHVVEKDGQVVSKPVDEVELRDGIAEAIGVAPKLYYSDLASLVGNLDSGCYYEVNRAASALPSARLGRPMAEFACSAGTWITLVRSAAFNGPLIATNAPNTQMW